MELDPRFWKSEPRALPESYEDVSNRCAVVEFTRDIYQEPSWGCIDKEFSVGYVFAYKSTKEYAIKHCQEL